ncbi:MAG: helix-turn-helix domain-containing protein [Candidatus Hodarchaeales archaeon]|jgi:DNA-binding MarR family transcriptional regulator
MSSLSTLDLFDNPTRSRISWNLLIHKELSASQLKKLLAHTSLSTITRNLTKMEEKGFIYQSRVEKLNNLETKFWKIRPEIFKEDADINAELYHQLNDEDKERFVERTSNIISLFFGFVRTMLEPNNFDISKIFTHPEQDHPSITITIMKQKTGDLFRKELKDIIKRFQEEQRGEVETNLNEIDLDSHLFFFFASKIKTLVPSLDDL